MNSKKNETYIPERQDIVWIDFDPIKGKEIQKRSPAVIVSAKKYSQLTGLTVVVPNTHATNNRFLNTDFLVSIQNSEITGFANPLQTFSFDFEKRNIKKLDK
ncbi:type II toxin-antitoxin system PemK/MazF family toxin [Tetragenococcus halophilus]|uniref:type II toxin-antitoxin system PemK/MazF family toxin n=1 Tax=Tetragenococcus halophilus TaxID=51669 RepID=UPI00077C7172|nr:type II toxin-antitoxin system PemK/MazF family toxin [Tetragenococcus halophilus]MCO8287646.1 type II toxin-antitoxin system PemK/MazF family toxin [Tetragenococcus halophilus]